MRRMKNFLNSFDAAFRESGIETKLLPGASRGIFLGFIISGFTLNSIGLGVVAWWARGALVWTDPRRLYAALVFMMLWKSFAIYTDGVKAANKHVCENCEHNHNDHDNT